MVWSGYERVTGKRPPCCILDSHHILTRQGVIAKTGGARYFVELKADPGFEPMGLGVRQTQKGYWSLEQIRGQSCDAVICGLRLCPQDLVQSKPAEPFLFKKIRLLSISNRKCHLSDRHVHPRWYNYLISLAIPHPPIIAAGMQEALKIASTSKNIFASLTLG